MNWVDVIAGVVVGLYAIFEARKRVGSLGGNLGPRVQELEKQVAELRGRLQGRRHITEIDGDRSGR